MSMKKMKCFPRIPLIQYRINGVSLETQKYIYISNAQHNAQAESGKCLDCSVFTISSQF